MIERQNAARALPPFQFATVFSRLIGRRNAAAIKRGNERYGRRRFLAANHALNRGKLGLGRNARGAATLPSR